MMFAKVAEGVWHPGIGDPTVAGWLTVAGYFAAGLFAWRVAWVARQDVHETRSENWFWFCGGSLLLLLGINKQLDLQTGMAWLLKQWALDQGWYEQRRSFQALFIAVLGVMGAGLFGLFLWFARSNLRRYWLTLAGSLFLITFVLIRASSFHYVDQMLGFRAGGLKLNWLLEWGGIACVLLGAKRVLKEMRTARASPPRRGGFRPRILESENL